MHTDMEDIWKQMEAGTLETPFEITLCNKLTGAKITVSVYKDSTLGQIVQAYGPSIGLDRKKCERYRDNTTIAQYGYQPNSTILLQP